MPESLLFLLKFSGVKKKEKKKHYGLDKQANEKILLLISSFEKVDFDHFCKFSHCFYFIFLKV